MWHNLNIWDQKHGVVPSFLFSKLLQLVRRATCLSQTRLPSLHPAINAPRRHDLFVSSGLAPKRPTASAAASHVQKHRAAFVLTDTGALRRSRAPEAALLFRPTRKCPRQATPPTRHRLQQQRSQLITQGREGCWRKEPEITEVRTKKGGKKRIVTMSTGRCCSVGYSYSLFIIHIQQFHNWCS